MTLRLKLEGELGQVINLHAMVLQQLLYRECKQNVHHWRKREWVIMVRIDACGHGTD